MSIQANKRLGTKIYPCAMGYVQSRATALNES